MGELILPEFPHWLHHPTEPSRLFASQEEVDAALAASPLWRVQPYSPEEVVAAQAQVTQSEEAPSEAPPSPRKR
jgi:hypothetical protein